MSIKQNGGVFGRNPTFNDVTIEGDLIINGEVFTGLDFQGSWNASTNSPALASSVGTNGEFYIVSVAGTTDLNGITNWGIGDWAIFNGTVWQRVEGGADGNFNNLTANSLTVDGDAVIQDATPTLEFKDTDNNLIASITGASGSLLLKADTGGGTAGESMQFHTGGVVRQNISAGGDISFYEDTGTTAKLFWDASAESLGIGTSSPATLAHLYADNATLTIQDSNNFTDTRIKFLNGSSSITGQVVAPSDAAGLEFYYGTLEAMRIDASGNLLVGTTAVQGAGGVTLASAGYVYASRPSSTAIYADRTGSDGTIIDFRKDGTAVGSIGVQGGANLLIGNGDTGIRFAATNNAIHPWNLTTLGLRDAAIDLGADSVRFKDLYLSGGVYLGGTGAANKLDDYETGTWTPTASSYDGTMTVTSATYVKVGKLVTIKANVSFDATADGSGVNIAGLPFITTGTAKANGGFVTSSTVSSAVRIQAVGTGSIYLLGADNSNVTYTTMSSTTLEFIMIYEAA
jgi:hypothetical protein